MSSRIPMALGMIAILPVAVHAAHPGTSVQKRVKPQTAASSTGQPKPSGVRSPAPLTPQTTFGEAIEILRNSTTPPLPIIVLWKPLGESAGVYRDTPIGMDGPAGLRVGQVLDLLMLSLSAGAPAKLGYAVDKGVITISTTDLLPTSKMVARVYDISDLVAAPARYSPITSGGFGLGYGMSYGGFMPPFVGYSANTGSGFYGLPGNPANPVGIVPMIGPGPLPYLGR
jgi:hypothetical protein